MNRLIKKARLLMALSALIVIEASASASEPQEWLFDIRYNISGITESFPAYHRAQCLTDSTPMPDIATSGQQCTTRIHGRHGNTLTWMIDCSSEWEVVQGVGSVTFDAGKAGGDVHMQILSTSGAPQYMVFHIEGRAGGSCDRHNSNLPITAQTVSPHTIAGKAGGIGPGR